MHLDGATWLLKLGLSLGVSAGSGNAKLLRGSGAASKTQPWLSGANVARLDSRPGRLRGERFEMRSEGRDDLPALTGLRGIAALLIVVGHFWKSAPANVSRRALVIAVARAGDGDGDLLHVERIRHRSELRSLELGGAAAVKPLPPAALSLRPALSGVLAVCPRDPVAVAHASRSRHAGGGGQCLRPPAAPAIVVPRQIRWTDGAARSVQRGVEPQHGMVALSAVRSGCRDVRTLAPELDCPGQCLLRGAGRNS